MTEAPELPDLDILGDLGDLGVADGSLLELVDHLLNQGVVLTGDLVLGLAGIDLIYARLSLVLCAADRILPRVERP
jgi:hypothetical protein